MPISAPDTITLAVQHTKRQLFQPFRFWQWTRLALVGLLAGEMGSAGNFHVPSTWKPNQHPSQHFLPSAFPNIDPAILGALIAVLLITGLVFMIVMMYINSVMRFILFDSVLVKECHIRGGWSRRQGPGWKYFLWQLGFGILVLAGVVLLLGLPAIFAWSKGWFAAPRDHLLPLILGGIVLFFVFALFLLAVGVVHVFTKDFVVPQMALEGIDAIEGWRRLWPMIEAEKGGYAVYVIMKIVLAIAASIIVGIASVILGLMFAIPAVVVAIGAVVTGKSAGLTWNVFTITAAVVAGCILLAILFYLIALISVPVIVFFPAYAMYFFAARYRALSLALYPMAQTSPLPSSGSPPPQEPPPFPSAPAPA